MANIFYETIFNQSGNTLGAWYPFHQANVPASLEVTGIAGDTIQVRFSNKRPDVTPSGNESQYGADITTNGKVAITEPFGWIAILKTAGASVVVVKLGSQQMIQ